MRCFNVTGLCVPKKHYMVDISEKLDQIVALIDKEAYFTINRARQYGKTTTLNMLEKRLAEDYICASISFEGVGDECFASAESFCAMFLEKMAQALKFSSASQDYADKWQNGQVSGFRQLGGHITALCENEKIVLLIDEVDKSTNNRTFLHFLGMLREKYLARQSDKDYTFHSVILVGVADVKNLKLKMINDGVHMPTATEGSIYNSPWNIAADFEVDMSFSPREIATMLAEYEADHQTGMDIGLIANEIYSFTSGYPFLVSRICKHIDEKLGKDWSENGVANAVKIILAEKNVLFDDLTKNLENYPDLSEFLYDLLILGAFKSFNYSVPVINLGYMYGYIKKGDGNGSSKTVVDNRIFEIFISDYFITKDEAASSKNRNHGLSNILLQDVIHNGRFDMELCLKKFAEHYAEIYNEGEAGFFEKYGRLLFLSYLKPLINEQGFYHIESQLTDLRRMDIVVDFGPEQFIIELKLWKGEAMHKDAYAQLAEYLDGKNVNTGWLLTFDFRKKTPKQPRAEWVDFAGKRIFDVVV
ncbi:MAG: AAA-like domain-containing protein [Lachnospiraceae bacterium]|jgi:hypothetical protein|nr:AAA-like domain-containing protein [Lachnospiraceae bacterium]